MDKKSKSLRERLDQNNVVGIICTLPFTLGFLLFMIVPLGISFYYSLCNYDILNPATFTGLDNYIKMFTADDRFTKSLGVTFYFALVSVPLRLIFALAIAMLLKKTSALTGFYRAVYYLPSIIGGSVAVAILWKRMFAIDGTINTLFGLDISWLGRTDTAIWTLIILAVWQFGSSMLIFLSALKQIPGELYEAADIDGSGKINTFFKVTIPLLTPTIFFNLVMQMINGFLAFTQSYIITQGRPMDSTLFYVVYMYEQSFDFRNTGYGAAMAWVMLALLGVITGILFLTKRFWVYEEG